MKTQEIVKFFSGIAVWEAIGHTALAFSGDLPLTVMGITFTPTLNAVIAVAGTLLSIGLIWYGWSPGGRAILNNPRGLSSRKQQSSV